MTIEQIRAFRDAKPFRPFVIHLADGRFVPVLNREYILAPPRGRTLVVCQPDDSTTIIDLSWVTDLKAKRTLKRRGKARKRRSD